VIDNSVLEGLSFSAAWIREMNRRNEKDFRDFYDARLYVEYLL
jgi:hypothetical protein